MLLVCLLLYSNANICPLVLRPIYMVRFYLMSVACNLLTTYLHTALSKLTHIWEFGFFDFFKHLQEVSLHETFTKLPLQCFAFSCGICLLESTNVQYCKHTVSLSFVLGHYCRKVLKHAQKTYNFFRIVCDRRI